MENPKLHSMEKQNNNEKGKKAVKRCLSSRLLVVDHFTSTASDMALLVRDHVRHSSHTVCSSSTLP